MSHSRLPGAVCAIAACLALASISKAYAEDDLAKLCARVGNDDTVRPYTPSLRDGTAAAFRTLFPEANATTDASMWQSQANYRCMNGRIFVCFIGANLPCAKISNARDNAGADAFCMQSPDADVVPAMATGHDALYSYRCRGGRAVVTHANWQLDARGFAKKLWTPLPAR